MSESVEEAGIEELRMLSGLIGTASLLVLPFVAIRWFITNPLFAPTFDRIWFASATILALTNSIVAFSNVQQFAPRKFTWLIGSSTGILIAFWFVS